MLKSIGRSLGLSALVLGPGIALLSTGHRLPGLAWLFVGSFGMLAWSYRAPWRPGFLSCVAPPLAAAGSYALQLALFASVTPPPPAALAVALAAGLAVGWLRGRTHTLYVGPGGTVMARRSVAYLAIWALSVGLTQALAFAATEVWLVRAGLVTGMFTTAMLATVSVKILLRAAGTRATARPVPAGAAALATLLVLPAAASAQEPPTAEEILRETLTGTVNITIDQELAEVTILPLLDETDRDLGEGWQTMTGTLENPTIRGFGPDRAQATYDYEAGLRIIVALERFGSAAEAVPGPVSLGPETMGSSGLAYRDMRFNHGFTVHQEPAAIEVASVTAKDVFRVTVRGRAPIVIGESDPESGLLEETAGAAVEAAMQAFLPIMLVPGVLDAVHGRLDVEAASAPAGGAVGEPPREPPPGSDDDPFEDPFDDPGDDPGDDAGPDVDEAVITTAVIAGILTAAGVAVSIAQSIAAGLGGLPGQGVQLTQAEIDQAVAEGQWRTAEQGAEPEPPEPPPPIVNPLTGAPYPSDGDDRHLVGGAWVDRAAAAAAAARGTALQDLLARAEAWIGRTDMDDRASDRAWTVVLDVEQGARARGQASEADLHRIRGIIRQMAEAYQREGAEDRAAAEARHSHTDWAEIGFWGGVGIAVGGFTGLWASTAGGMSSAAAGATGGAASGGAVGFGQDALNRGGETDVGGVKVATPRVDARSVGRGVLGWLTGGASGYWSAGGGMLRQFTVGGGFAAAEGGARDFFEGREVDPGRMAQDFLVGGGLSVGGGAFGRDIAEVHGGRVEGLPAHGAGDPRAPRPRIGYDDIPRRPTDAHAGVTSAEPPPPSGTPEHLRPPPELDAPRAGDAGEAPLAPDAPLSPDAPEAPLARDAPEAPDAPRASEAEPHRPPSPQARDVGPVTSEPAPSGPSEPSWSDILFGQEGGSQRPSGEVSAQPIERIIAAELARRGGQGWTPDASAAADSSAVTDASAATDTSAATDDTGFHEGASEP